MAERPAVIVPTCDGAGRLADLLTSLREQTLAHEVVVVDNGSTDDTHRLVAERFPEVRVVALEENVGFGRAVNRGVAECDAATIVLLNDDVVCERDFLERLCATLSPDEGVVMAAAVLVQAARPDRIDTAGVMFDRTLLAFDHLQGEPVCAARNGVLDPLGPSGAAAAFHRAAFERVGGFDEAFFAYLEDVDLVARLLADGARCRLARDARGTHRHSATLGSASRRKNELMGWGRGYTLGKYRLHRRPALFARAALAELVIVAGQLAIDRTAVGVGARLAGFRAGRQAEGQALPALPTPARRISLVEALRRRLRRRTR
jgi:N-acetylglucosaminyl-diphospho-decaprenol L-rhamnosyltransferase